jgi:integral membrane sensor domain MASE1
MVKGQFSDLLKTPAPAYMHYPRTYLEGASVDAMLSSIYLRKAAEASDPIERLKNIVCFYIGGNHISVS